MRLVIDLDNVQGLDDEAISETIRSEIIRAVQYHVKGVIGQVVKENKGVIESAVREVLVFNEKAIKNIVRDGLKVSTKRGIGANSV